MFKPHYFNVVIRYSDSKSSFMMNSYGRVHNLSMTTNYYVKLGIKILCLGVEIKHETSGLTWFLYLSSLKIRNKYLHTFNIENTAM